MRPQSAWRVEEENEVDQALPEAREDDLDEDGVGGDEDGKVEDLWRCRFWWGE